MEGGKGWGSGRRTLALAWAGGRTRTGGRITREEGRTPSGERGNEQEPRGPAGGRRLDKAQGRSGGSAPTRRRRRTQAGKNRLPQMKAASILVMVHPLRRVRRSKDYERDVGLTGASMALVADGGCRVTDSHDARIGNSWVSQSKVKRAVRMLGEGEALSGRGGAAMTLGRKQVMEEGGSRVAPRRKVLPRSLACD